MAPSNVRHVRRINRKYGALHTWRVDPRPQRSLNKYRSAYVSRANYNSGEYTDGPWSLAAAHPGDGSKAMVRSSCREISGEDEKCLD